MTMRAIRHRNLGLMFAIESCACLALVTCSSPALTSWALAGSGTCRAPEDHGAALGQWPLWPWGGHEGHCRPRREADYARRVSDVPGGAVGIGEHPRRLVPQADRNHGVFPRPPDHAHTIRQLGDALEHGRLEALP